MLKYCTKNMSRHNPAVYRTIVAASSKLLEVSVIEMSRVHVLFQILYNDISNEVISIEEEFRNIPKKILTVNLCQTHVTFCLFIWLCYAACVSDSFKN